MGKFSNMNEEDKLGSAAIAALAIGAFVVLIVCVFIPFCGGAGPNYSNGTRYGTIAKFSHKGVIWTSGEGTLMLGGTMPGAKGTTVPAIWDFSTRDDALGAKVEALANKGARVKVTYREWFIGPMQQSTSYTITDVEEVKD